MVEVEVLRADEVPPALLQRSRALMDDAFDGDFSDQDWEHSLGGWHAIVTAAGRVVAHACVVPRTLQVGDRELPTGYVEAVATSPDHQQLGYGTRAMRALDGVLRERFAFGALSTDAYRFYEQLGWERWQGPTYVIADDGTWHRTADEDDGIMVLRYGSSAEVALTDPIACHTRRGDDW